MMIHVEDYIGGFLLKNKYCTFPSLGTIKLEKASASFDQDQLSPPDYILHFSPIGIIDDAFPTYIADHENVSIAKASNEIRSFSQQVKASLQKSGRYDVDSIGSFLLKDNEVIFKQSADLNLGFSPIRAEEPKVEPQSKVNYETESSSSTSFKNLEYTHADSRVPKPKYGGPIKIFLGLLLLGSLLTGAYFLYNYIQSNKKVSTLETAEIVSEQEYQAGEAQVSNANSTNAQGDSSTQNTVSVPSDSTSSGASASSNATVISPGEHKIAVQSFLDKAAAESKSKKLNNYGNKTQVVTVDGKHWLVVVASHSSNDMTLLKDSLRKFFNPSGEPFEVK